MTAKNLLFAYLVLYQGTSPARAETDLLVSSWYSGEIIRYDGKTGEFIQVFVGSGVGGLRLPEGLAVGPDANLYVASMGSQAILRYEVPTGEFLGTFASGHGLGSVRGITFGSDNNLYVANNDDRVLRFDGHTGEFIDVFAQGNGLRTSEGLVFGRDGHLYVTGRGGHAVLRFDGQTGEFIDIFTSGAQMNAPQGMMFGPGDHLYVCSSGDDTVLRFDSQTGEYIDTFVKPGSGGLDNPETVLFQAAPTPPSHGSFLLVSSWRTDNILRYNAKTGEFEGVFASGGGLDGPTYMIFAELGEHETCTGREKLSTSCRPARQSNKLKAKVRRGKKRARLTFRLDGDPRTDIVVKVGTGGRARVKFRDVSAGGHTVAIVECRVEKGTVCPP